jgi:hypothetical protein
MKGHDRCCRQHGGNERHHRVQILRKHDGDDNLLAETPNSIVKYSLVMAETSRQEANSPYTERDPTRNSCCDAQSKFRVIRDLALRVHEPIKSSKGTERCSDFDLKSAEHVHSIVERYMPIRDSTSCFYCPSISRVTHIGQTNRERRPIRAIQRLSEPFSP